MSSYNAVIANIICERLTKGESLQTICKTESYPHINTVMDWLRENQEFSVQYARAREAQADYLAEEIIDIADNELLPPDSRRIRVDVRKWYAGKVKPKKYGDSTQIKHADADGNKLTLQSVLGEINGRSADLPRAEEIPE